MYLTEQDFHRYYLTYSTPAMLLPTTPTQTTRYESKSLPRADHTDVLEFGAFSVQHMLQKPSLPFGWTPSDHPEGNVYFVQEGGPRVVTDVDLTIPALQEVMSHWTSVACGRLKAKEIPISDSFELYLRPEGPSKCHYYFADHTSQVIFWVDPVPIDDLKFEVRTSSAFHLRTGLREMYWSHVEHFPAHHVPEMSLGMDKLMDHFIFAQADTLTSPTSTMPFGPEMYEKCIKMLQIVQGTNNPESSSTKWFVARQWSQYYRGMFFNHSGEAACRLDRNQRIMESPGITKKWWFNALSPVLFNVPEFYYLRLDGVWHDNMVHQNDWKPLITDTLSDWQQSRNIAFGTLFMNVLTQQTYCGELSLIATVVCIIGTVSATVLLSCHQSSKLDDCPSVARYLSKACKPGSGFQARAITNSVPRAMAFWSITLTSLNILTWVLGEATGLNTQTIAVAFLGLVAIVACSWLIVSAMKATFSLCRRARSTEDVEKGEAILCAGKHDLGELEMLTPA